MSTLQVGDKAPSFTAIGIGGIYGSGTPVSLAELKGKPVVLYFYPKDDTPGCTTQACGIRDAWGDINKTGTTLFGVSIDPVKSHEKFIAKFDLPFPLLSDPEKSIVSAYGVWVEKSMYGKKYMGTERTTFVIDGKGIIVAIFPKVKPGEHADLVIQTLKELCN
ncbi:MAG: thioredoxin-dependent thiol peroxidase [bacterium]